MRETQSWDPVELERRRRLGDSCFKVMAGNRCIHYSWATERRRVVAEIGYRADLGDQMMWIYDCYTAPSHRGNAIFPRVIEHIMDDAKKRDVRSVWIDVDEDNQASLRAVRKAGFAPAALLSRTIALSSITVEKDRVALRNGYGDMFRRMPYAWESDRYTAFRESSVHAG